VLVAPKDFNRPTHPDITTVRNLEVIKAMQSLTSKGFVKTQFSWQWYYYTLTDEGLAYLREWLNLPAEIVPQTHMKPARPAGRPAGYGAGAREGGAYRAPRGDREYRRRDDAGEDKEGAGAGYRPVSATWFRLDLELTGSDSAVLADRLLLPRKCAPRRCTEVMGWRRLRDAGAGGCRLGRLGVPGFMHSAVLEPRVCREIAIIACHVPVHTQ
jgi:small subunit ribosomal protein S10e